MKKIIFFSLFASLVFSFRMVAEITTPYPTTIELKQIYGAEHERLRLAQGHKKFEQQPTGFYVESGKTLVVDVEVVKAAKDEAMPKIHIGTMGFNVDGRGRVDIALTAGLNTITPAQMTAVGTLGGLIYLSFVTNGNAAPEGVARVTFTDASEQVRAPHYIYGVTTNTEFKEMMDTYQTPDVGYHSNYVVVAATRSAAQTHSYNNNKVAWMNDLHDLLAREDAISGMDNNDPNPVHHRFNVGEIRYLLVQNTSASPHANSIGYTGYPSASTNRYLTVFGPGNNSWMLGHELGHQHQQPAYMINLATESTVNIYSYVEERAMWEAANPGQTYNRTSAERWTGAQSTYLRQPVAERVYDMDSDELQALTGFNRDELRFMVWEQLFLIFGDQFYKTLHRVVREEKVTGGGAEERRFYLIWKASQVSGYDLREYFNQWGIRVTDAALKTTLQKNFEAALTSGKIIDLPQPVTNVIKITGQNRPAWSPLPLRGITSSAPTLATLDPAGWTITANIEGFTDNGIGGNLVPEFIIDGQMSTAFAFVKPGKTYGGVTAPSDYVPSFTINMQESKTFNYFSYKHRISNGEERLRARKISFSGKLAESDDWTPIVENHVIDHVANNPVITVTFPAVSYQYVKLDIEDWNKEEGMGMSIQIAEFELGIDSSIPYEPEDPNTALPSVLPDGDVVSTRYYDLNGREIAAPTVKGVYIQRDLLNTGKVRVRKIVFVR